MRRDYDEGQSLELGILQISRACRCAWQFRYFEFVDKKKGQRIGDLGARSRRKKTRPSVQIRRGRNALSLFRGFNETSRIQYFLPVERRTEGGRYRANFPQFRHCSVFASINHVQDEQAKRGTRWAEDWRKRGRREGGRPLKKIILIKKTSLG